MGRREILTLFQKSNVLGSSLLGKQQNLLNNCQLCATSRLFGVSHRRSFVSQRKEERKKEEEEYTHFGYEKVKEDEKVDRGMIMIIVLYLNSFRNYYSSILSCFL